MERKEVIKVLSYLKDGISARQLEIEEKEGEEYDKLDEKLEEYYEALEETINYLEKLELIHEISKCM